MYPKFPKSSKNSLQRIGWFSPFWKLKMTMMLVCMVCMHVWFINSQIIKIKYKDDVKETNSKCAKFTIKILK